MTTPDEAAARELIAEVAQLDESTTQGPWDEETERLHRPGTDARRAAAEAKLIVRYRTATPRLAQHLAQTLDELHRERLANVQEHDQWSRAVAVLGLAPYGSAYDPALVLPAVQALVATNREMRRRLEGRLPRFEQRRQLVPLPTSSTPHTAPEPRLVHVPADEDAEPLVQEARRAQLSDAIGEVPEDDAPVFVNDDVGPLTWHEVTALLFGGPAVEEVDPASLKQIFPGKAGEFDPKEAPTTPAIQRARLDPEGTAKGKTILTAPIVGQNGPAVWPGHQRTHVDTETGVRTPLNYEDET